MASIVFSHAFQSSQSNALKGDIVTSFAAPVAVGTTQDLLATILSLHKEDKNVHHALANVLEF